MSGSHAFTPFPDLTGWRSSAACRAPASQPISVWQRTLLSLAELSAAAERLGAEGPDEVVVAAWAIVLIHLLSQEEDLSADVVRQPYWHVHLSCLQNERSKLSISALLQQLKGAKAYDSSNDTDSLADNVVAVDLLSRQKQPLPTSRTALFFTADLSTDGQDHLSLSLQASPLVHHTSSAQMHLSQVASCLAFLCQASPSTPALSLQHYPDELLAGDNPLPSPLMDDIGGKGLSGLERERFEHQMERVAKATPQAIALDFRATVDAKAGDEGAGNVLWTYEELNNRAERICHHIQSHLTTQAGTEIVALCLEKSVFTYVSILAVLKAGAAWCPIDTDWPAARREALLAKSGAKVVLTAGDEVAAALTAVLPSGMSIIRLDAIDYGQALKVVKQRSEASSDSLAYLIWTSGTTGLPKAVGIQHKAAVQALRSLQRVIPHDGSDLRYLQFSAYNFDLMILDVFYTWGLGGTLCASSRSMLLTNLVALSNALQVTHTLLTPAVMAMTPRESIPTLGVVINGGEKLSQVVADSWSVDCCLLNLYGPAEATLIAMNRLVPPLDQVKAPNIGTALPTTSCHAVDTNDDVVLKGAVGQLILGGHQCAVGYVGEADKTEAKFVQHARLGRVYRTGDLVRQLSTGDFEYLGRSDDQIKVNGIRIELLEVNAVIRSAAEEVKDSETLVVKTANDDDNVQIVNFSVAPLGQSNGKTIIRTDEEAVKLARQLAQCAQDSLPSYMVPSLFIIVTHFPRTSSAKIDREALRIDLDCIDRLDWLNRLADVGSIEDGEAEEPQSQTIRAHLAVLCDIPVDKIGRHTPFPSLGLNSIKAITLSHRLRESGISAPVVEIVQFQTLASLADRLKKTAGRGEDRRKREKDSLFHFDTLHRPRLEEGLPSLPIASVMPVSPLQEALIAETIRDKSRYWLHRVYSLPLRVDEARLAGAIQAAVAAMEILRTCFVDATNTAADDSAPTEAFLQLVLAHHRVPIITVADSGQTLSDESIVETVRVNIMLQVLDPRPAVAFVLLQSEQPRLIAVLHHALYDQVTLARMESTIGMFYNGRLAPPTKSFSFALQHLITWDEEQRAERQATWQRLLSSYPKGQAASFPNLSGREAAVSTDTLTSSYHCDSTIQIDTAAQAARQMQTSIRPILQAAWAAVLSVYCDSMDVLIGDSVSARATSMELNDVAGPVLDTLPVPIHLNASFRQVVSSLDTFHKQAISCPSLPLRQVRKMMKIPPDFPLFASVFVFEPPAEDNEEEGEEGAAALLSKPHDYAISVEHVVAVEVRFTSQGYLQLGLVARDSAVSPSSAKLLLAQWESAIIQAIKQPDDPATAFSQAFFSPHLLSVSKQTVPDSLAHACKTPVFAALSRWAKATPLATAVDFSTSLDASDARQTKTYVELDDESSRASCLFIKMLPPGSVVAVCLHRSIETYVTLLAVFKAGMTYLPLDSSLPAERKATLVRDSRAVALVWSSSTQWNLASDLCSTLCFCIDDPADALAQAIASRTSAPPFPPGLADQTSDAYILYTSGSTGMPKGCTLTHGNLSSAIESFRLMFETHAPHSLDSSTRFLARSIEAFDVALLETLLPLQVGGTIVTGPRQLILQDVGFAMKALQVTHAALVPSLFYTQGRRVVPDDVPDLRALIVGGERITGDIIQAWASSNVPLLNAYGPTEACIGTSVARLCLHDSTGNIGRPFAGTQYVVLKSTARGLRLALRGEAGELCIAGLQIGSYLHQPHSASFFDWNGQRLYRTGDEVRLSEHDDTEYLGRVSSSSGQVKVRGVRIELGEIDGVLEKAAKASRFRITRLVGQPASLVSFIAPAASSAIEEDGLQSAKEPRLQEEAQRVRLFATRHLPSYMVPRLVIALNQMPLAPISGKVDVKRIDAWFDAHQAELLASSVADERRLDERETMVKEEIERLFAVNVPISPSTDVFALGLDSLNVIALSNRLTKRGIAVDVAYIMANATVEAIARGGGALAPLTDTAVDYTKEARLALGGIVEVKRSYPLLPLQESMVTQTVADGAWRYINVVRLACKGEIDRSRLESSLLAALNHHDIYQTVFIEVGGKLVQAVTVGTQDLGMEEEAFEAGAVEGIAKTLDRTPPLRYCLSSCGRRLSLAIHHALYDGESLQALLREIQERYAGKQTTESARFADYISRVSSMSMESKLSDWQRQLDDFTITPFPSLTGKRLAKEVSRERSSLHRTTALPFSRLRQRAREDRVTLQMAVLDAFARLYSKYVGEDQVTFGLVLGGRSGKGADVHGPCINTVPFSYRIQEASAWQGQMQKRYGQALRSQHVSLPALSRRLGVQGSLFNALFSYTGAQGEVNSLFEELSSHLTTEYPIAVEVQEREKDDEMELQIIFDEQYLTSRQAAQFLHQLDIVITASQTEEAVMAMENVQPYMPTPSDSFLSRFRAQVELQPDAIAFVFSHDFAMPNEETTYRQLDAHSDAMAAGLMEEKGMVVGVLMKQSTLLYPLLLAIWKTGKVYLPLDPALPLERLEYIVSVARPSMVMATQEDMTLAQRLGRGRCVDGLANKSAPAIASSAHHDCLDSAAYIMFTSGSSGKPKGVQISHLALAAAIYSWDHILPHSNQSRILQLASPGFDVFLIEVCMPLALGFSFASARKDELLNDLEATFVKLDLTMADLPAVLATTVSPDRIANNRKLEWLMSGGDQIDDKVIETWSHQGLVNAWGPTETTIGNTLGFVSLSSSRNWIGRAYPTSSLYILDSHSSQVVFRGCLGEIAVGGPQLADCYVGNAALTEEKFITLPDGTRVYRTGDRGRLLCDGSLECLGRLDAGQVKVNSQRVELGEIEVQLKKHRDVIDVAVLYLKHRDMKSKQLVAFFIMQRSSANNRETYSQEAGPREDVALCLEEASRHLAGYMIPAHCLILAARRLPLTPNNKVDAKKLAAMYSSLSGSQIRQLDARHRARKDDATPRSITEQRLRAVVAAFCGVEEREVGREASFYRLGIDSISGFRLLRKLRDGGFTNLTLRDILKAPTIALLAKHLESIEGQEGGREWETAKAASLDRQWRPACNVQSWRLDEDDDIRRILPCTPLQEGLLLETLASEGELYVQHHLFTVPRHMLARVISAVEEMASVHDIFRTSFHLVDGQFLQAVHAKQGLLVHRQAVDTSQVQAAVSQLLSTTPFCDEEDLARPPMMVSIVESSSLIVFDFVMHHALYDGESLGMLFEEIEARVTDVAAVGHRPAFEVLLPALLSHPNNESFFADRLAGCRDTLLGSTLTSSPSARPCLVGKRVMKVKMETLCSFASSVGTSAHVVALYAYSKLLGHLTKQRDLVFAQLFSLRDGFEGADEVLGPALNAVLTRVVLADGETTCNALSRMQRDNDASREHRCASMTKVQRLLAKDRGGESVHFDSLFDFQRNVEKDVQPHSALLSYDNEEEDKVTQYALNVQCKQQGDTLSLTAVADSNVFTQQRLNDQLEMMEAILEMTIGGPDRASTCMPDGVDDLHSLPLIAATSDAMAISALSPSGLVAAASFHCTTEEEGMVAEVVAELTDMEPEMLDVTAPVSQFGLDSIMAIKMASLLRKRGATVGVVDILRGKTIEGIGSRLEQRRSGTLAREKKQGGKGDAQDGAVRMAASALHLSTNHIVDVLPLLPGQQFEMADFVQSKGKKGIYTFSYKLNVEGIDDARLKRAWSRLRDRHAVLRAAFVVHEGVPFQVILNHDGGEDSGWHTRHHSEPVETQLGNQAWLDEVCGLDMDMRSPPCASCLVSAPDGFFFILRLHHAMYDAWAIAILMNDLWCLYNGDDLAKSSGSHVDLVKHTVAERQLLYDEARGYWKTLFQDVTPCMLGPASPPTASHSSHYSFASFPAVVEEVNLAEGRLRGLDINLGMAFIAAWSRQMLRLFGSQEKVVFGLYHRGRSSAFDGVETVVSNCMNVLPMVVSRAENKGGRAMAIALKEQMDEQTRFESSTSISDIHTWLQTDKAQWNCYLNLVWGGDGVESSDSIFQPVDAVSLLEGVGEEGEACRRTTAFKAESLADVSTDVNIDVHWDRQRDTVNVALRYRSDICTPQQVRLLVRQMVDDVERMIEDA